MWGPRLVMAIAVSLSAVAPGFTHSVSWSSAVCPAPFDACVAAMKDVVGAFAGLRRFTAAWANESVVEIADVDGTDIHIWYKCDADINGYVVFVFESNTDNDLRRKVKAEFATLITDRLGVTCKS